MEELFRTLILRLECIADLIADGQGKRVTFHRNGYDIEPKEAPPSIRIDIDGVTSAVLTHLPDAVAGIRQEGQ